MVAEIAQNTTLNAGEVELALKVLGQVAERRVAEGQIVDLDNLCTIYPSISSDGADTEADFNANTHIRKVGVRIRPKANLVAAAQAAALQKK